MRVLGLVELLLVEVRGVIPSEVLVARAERHLHEALPVRLVGVDRLTEGPLKLVRGRALEGPPGTVVLAVEVTHGIPEASHGVHHRHRSVVHGVELVEAARLKPGGHEEDVAARGDAVRHLVAEPQPRPDLVPVPALHVVETVLEVLPAAAEEDELDVLVHEELLGVEHEVDALLLIETTDETNHDRVVALGGRGELLDLTLVALPVSILARQLEHPLLSLGHLLDPSLQRGEQRALADWKRDGGVALASIVRDLTALGELQHVVDGNDLVVLDGGDRMKAPAARVSRHANRGAAEHG